MVAGNNPGRSRKHVLTRAFFCLGASSLAMLSPATGHAQTAAVRNILPRAGVAATTTGAVVASGSLQRSATMQQALANQINNQARITAMRQVVSAARNAAVAATRSAGDGLSANGLDPIQAIKDAMAAAAAGDTATVNAKLASTGAANDTTGLATWQGAGLPGQSTDAAGNVTVTIKQTDARALLSWNSFNVGAKTSLVFNQQGNSSWTVVNRVVNSTAPSTILGTVKADGTVVVLNSQGVVFGQNSQVNLQSLLVSTLELGAAYTQTTTGQVRNQAVSLQARNEAFLQNGLFAAISTSPLLAPNLDSTGQLTFATDSASIIAAVANTPVEGAIVLDAGAQITAATGGYVIMAAPTVDSAASITASQGQISLQGGRFIYASASSGSSSSVDPNVRGYVLRTFEPGRDDPTHIPASTLPDDGYVVNRGVLDSEEGYLSLGAGIMGKVENDGLLAASTSVSRNGKVALIAGTVTMGQDALTGETGAISILPLENGETIPQGDANNPANFKASQIEIGAYGRTTLTDMVGTLTPGQFTMDSGALIYAPGAAVVVGRAAGTADPLTSQLASGIDILGGATIDVSGLKDVQLAASANSVEIAPVKQNELANTPNYRSASTNGSFTLNGATLYIDPRVTGVRADGTAWVGSPLLEAGSVVADLPETVSQFMTKGGSVTLNVNGITAATSAAKAPHVNVAAGATIDISGGWVNYAAGLVRTSKLVTADGGLVDISKADPNAVYIGVSDGYESSQPNFGVNNSFTSTLSQTNTVQASYDQGSDAGWLAVGASAINFGGTINGRAFAGARQVAQGLAASGTASFAAGTRTAQLTTYQLPVGGAVQIGSFSGAAQAGLGADIIVYAGTRNAGASYVQTLLSADMLSQAGLSALKLQTSGAVTFTGGKETLLDPAALTLAGASQLTLAAGGLLDIEAGRNITFNGAVSVPSGTVKASTIYLADPAILGLGTTVLASTGSPFTTADDLAATYASQADVSGLYDITVNGTISTAGLFTNDYLVTNGLYGGSAYTNGGTISLTAASNVFAPISSDGGATLSDVADLSGRITIADQALLDVSAGAYVAASGALSANAKGGNIALIDQTVYAPIDDYYYTTDGTLATLTYLGAPSVRHAGVFYKESALKAFGFAGSGGGTFTLVAPDVTFGSDAQAGTSTLSLGFFANTGFGALNVSSLRSVDAGQLFAGDARHYALAATTSFTIHAGETFNLTQTVLPSLLDAGQLQQLRALASGSSLTSVLTPAVPTNAWDQSAASLTLGGLTELDIAAGGTLTGAAQASLTVPKLYNAGTILLHGGTITQKATLPAYLAVRGLGVGAGGYAGLGALLGAASASGSYAADAANSAGITLGNVVDTARQLVLTGDLYYLGQMGQNVGVALAAGSVTDLSGVVVYNPYAAVKTDGTRVVTGRLIDGGSLLASGVAQGSGDYFSLSAYDNDRFVPTTASPNERGNDVAAYTAAAQINAASGASLNLSGASASFDVASGPNAYVATAQWSNGGTLSGLGGGTIAGATITAAGGSSAATGGTLEWLNPTLTSALAGTGANQLLDTQVSSAGWGFDTLIARGGATFAGTADITLRKAFVVSTAPVASASATSYPDLVVSAASGANAAVNAPYIRIASQSGQISLSNAKLNSAANKGTARLALNAGSLGLDVVGAVLFDGTIATTTLTSAGDLRLTGVNDTPVGSAYGALNGEVLAEGNLTIDAARTYATTGTGNLQRILQDLAAGTPLDSYARPFEIDAFGTSTITFLGTHINTATPLSAGSYLRVQAANIVQDGYLAAPLGIVELGGSGATSVAGEATSYGRAVATGTLTFGAGSITSVSAANTTVGGVSTAIPYGTTTDLTDYYFSPTYAGALTVSPSGEFIVSGGKITVAAGATLNGTGGGDVYGYEFVSGTGGTRDVLSRFNYDQYSANSYSAASGYGYQYADGRQVYAILPVSAAGNLAYYDPLYSADYAGLYASQVGKTVHLDGGAGVAAGDYVLLPAQYALLPGAYRLVENTGTAAPYAGVTTQLLDGSIVMGGVYGTAGTGLSGSTRYGFTLQSQSTLRKYSAIDLTSLTTTIQGQASANSSVTPRLALDAARVVLAPASALDVEGSFELAAATGGQATKIDISASNIVIGASDPGTSGALFLSNATLANLNANSLFIGGVRKDNADGSTDLNITASTIAVNSDAVLSAPEIVMAVGTLGAGSAKPVLSLANGATITATGTLTDTRKGDYNIPYSAAGSSLYSQTGVGVALRVATGTERLFNREGDYVGRQTLQPALLKIGAATLTGTNIALDSSRQFSLSNNATLAASHIAVSGDTLALGAGDIPANIEAKLAAAAQLTLRSPGAIRFANGTHTFNDLVLDTPAIAKQATSAALQAAAGNVTINANNLTWYASKGSFAGCNASGALGCGVAGSSLAINAATITFGSGALGVAGFNTGSSVQLAASNGIYIAGAGSLSVADTSGLASTASSLSLVAPFIIDSAAIANPLDQTVKPAFAFDTLGAFSLTAPALASGASAPTPTGNRAPGASITIGSAAAPVASATIDGAAIIATAGSIDIEAQGNITLANAAQLSVPGYTRTFGDSVDSTTVSAGGGTLTLTSLGGNIVLPASASLITDTGTGSAGALNLLAAQGSISLAARLNPGVSGPRANALTFDAGSSAFDLAGFVSQYGALFQGDLSIRAGAGNLVLNAGQTLRAASVTLTADAAASGEGQITIAGTIDTSGLSVAGLTLAATENLRVDGGNVSLYGNNGLTLASTGLIDTHTTGYLDTDTRQASAGNVTLGIGTPSAALRLADGGLINAGAYRLSGQSGNRLVAKSVLDPVALTNALVYDFVAADAGGTVTLRAPVDAATSSHVNIVLPASLPVKGASAIQIEGYKTYDLDALAKNSTISGISAAGGTVSLDPTAQTAGAGTNLLADSFAAGSLQSLPYFIQHFALSAADGSAFDGAISLRPGVVLTTSGNLTLASNWNLGAGTIDYAKALANGDVYAYTMNGNTYYAAVAGHEASILANDTHMVYRVGTGLGNIANAAPLVTLRAGKTLTSDYSITDGLFTFRDTTNADYMNYALGGGNRAVLPAATLSCAGNDCSGAFGSSTVAEVLGQIQSGALDSSQVVKLNLTNLVEGADVTTFTAPLTQQANSVAFADASGTVAGDPMSAAEVFPLLGGGSAYAHSASLRLVGGAGAGVSANPLHVDRGSLGDVVVDGVHSYTISAAKGTNTYATDTTGASVLDLALTYLGTGLTGNTTVGKTYAALGSGALDALNGAIANTPLPTVSGDEYTVLSWGAGSTPLATYLRAKAAAYFSYASAATYDAGSYQSGQKVGFAQTVGKTTTGVATSLTDALGFMNSLDPATGKTIAQTIAAGVVAGNYAASSVSNSSVGALGVYSTVNYGSIVRTGDGSIDVAAARDIQLVRASDVVRAAIQNNASATGTGATPDKYQQDGTAIYTVGHLALTSPLAASTADGSVSMQLTFAQAANDVGYLDGNYAPSALQAALVQPDLLQGGGAITLAAGRDVVGRRNYWAEVANSAGAAVYYPGQGTQNALGALLGSYANYASRIGSATQLWRPGEVGQDTLVGIAPDMFTSGVGTLGGGNITVSAGRNVAQLTLALDTSIVTANARSTFAASTFDRFATLSAADSTGSATAPVMATLGGGNLSLSVGGNLVGGLVDVASGQAQIRVGGDIAADTTSLVKSASLSPVYDSLRLRVTDAAISATVNGTVAMTGINAMDFGASKTAYAGNSAGFFTDIAGLTLVADGAITLTGDAQSAGVQGSTNGALVAGNGFVLPGTLNLASLDGDISLTQADNLFTTQQPYLLYPSSVGNLSLLAGGSISDLSVAMLDSDTSLLPGAFSANSGSALLIDGNVPFVFPQVSPLISNTDLRLFHKAAATHANDPTPVRIYVGGSLSDATLALTKQARIGVGQDIVNMVFVGQNLASGDTTRITAGRDIIGTVANREVLGSTSQRQVVLANSFVLGGPGTFDIEAGRNLGPFLSSGTITQYVDTNGNVVAAGTAGAKAVSVSYAGGIRTVGNEYNPWLGATGADLNVLYGVAGGVDYAALRSTYLDPANLALLDGALFVQVSDSAGNNHPDRSRAIYAPILARWMQANDPAGFAAVFAGADTSTDAALVAASYTHYAALYAAFAQLSQLEQNKFLIKSLYFNELASVSDAAGPSYQQYIRGYRAVQTLFPASWGYTDNLATYTTPASSISADHPLGVPTRITVNGVPVAATKVHTGNADLRLATIETDRGGDITILGPGGNFIAGSVVRTSQEILTYGTTAAQYAAAGLNAANSTITADLITAVPLGYEGILTLRGGAINTFTDGDFRLNQSRVFTLAGGNITMWSSNGDLNAGQGAKSAADFPPITIEFDPDGNTQVDSAGSVSGAGIGAFKSSPADPASSVTLVAPAGTVDAGDAGVRASGDILVTAAHVANADNFRASGSVSGVPSASAVAAPSVPSNAAAAVVANVARIADSNRAGSDKTIITVEVTGFGCNRDNANDGEDGKAC